MEALGVLDVDGLDVAVELLLGALLVVTSPRDADAESVGNALDTLLPDLLVELGVDTDIGGALHMNLSASGSCPELVVHHGVFVAGLGVGARVGWDASVQRTIAWVAKALISLMALGALFLKVTPWSCLHHQHLSPLSVPRRCVLTRLWRWMVYSRATTSAMAERWVLPVGFLVADDILERTAVSQSGRTGLVECAAKCRLGRIERDWERVDVL